MKPAAIALMLLVFATSSGAQTLGIDGPRFTIDGRPKFLLFVSYFDGLRRAAAGNGTGDVDTDFAYLRRAGFDGVRLMANWQYTCGGGPDDDQKLLAADGTINEAMWPVFVRFLERAAARGLVVDVTFTRETYGTAIPVDGYQKGIASVARRLVEQGGHRQVLFDIQNEYPLHGLTSDDVHGILTAVRQADPARIVTASGGGTDILDDPAMSVVAYHDARNDDWYEAAAARRQLDAVRAQTGNKTANKPIYLQEPMPFRKFHGACGHGEWPRSGFARRAASAMRQAGAAAWTFHTRQSFDLRSRMLVEILKGDPDQKEELEAISGAAGSSSGG
jgi:hypothetical protein